MRRSNITFSNIYDGERRDDTLPPLPDEAAPRARALLERVMPRIGQLPASMLRLSMRQIAAKLGGVEPEQLDRIDRMLAAL